MKMRLPFTYKMRSPGLSRYVKFFYHTLYTIIVPENKFEHWGAHVGTPSDQDFFIDFTFGKPICIINSSIFGTLMDFRTNKHYKESQFRILYN